MSLEHVKKIHSNFIHSLRINNGELKKPANKCEFCGKKLNGFQFRFCSPNCKSQHTKIVHGH